MLFGDGPEVVHGLRSEGHAAERTAPRLVFALVVAFEDAPGPVRDDEPMQTRHLPVLTCAIERCVERAAPCWRWPIFWRNDACTASQQAQRPHALKETAPLHRLRPGREEREVR